MKTPREILLHRHRSVTSRLDAIRREVLAEFPVRTEPEANVGTSFLREFLLPLRWHLAAMSALWVFAALLNIESGSPVSQTARNQSPSSQALVALFENRRQLAEMINSPSDDVAITAPVPPPFTPRRRSDIQPSSVAV
jgi:hypothetical protein